MSNTTIDQRQNLSPLPETRYVTRQPGILSGEPIIRGTRTPVRAIIETWRLGTPIEEIPQHLPHLTLAQVFDAMSFYQDNMDEVNYHIERNHIAEELIHPLVRNELVR